MQSTSNQFSNILFSILPQLFPLSKHTIEVESIYQFAYSKFPIQEIPYLDLSCKKIETIGIGEHL